ncbi:pilus assembly protein CpaC [Candidatus Entotheonella serta]|nr:pilus assembly protein CpaC [Candidatus Entotheonella serta]
MIAFNPNRRLTVVMFAVVLCGLALSAQAQPKLEVQTQPMARYSVAMGQSVLINTTNAVRQVSLAAPEIADSVLLSSRQIYVIGKKIGTTTLTLWDSGNNVSVLDIEVTPDIVGFKEKLWEILPLEKTSIGVTAANGGITLFGKVSSTANMDQALALAELFAPEQVTNLMQVGGVNQVMLEVRVAEMQSTLTKRLGINFTAFTDGRFFGLNLFSDLVGIGSLLNTGRPGPPALEGVISSSINSILQFDAGDVTVTGFIDALKSDGLIKILAEPTLVALSGHEAKFLAGGEFPIIVPQNENQVTIEFRSFGVALGFTPTVLSADHISIQVSPEVSELDFTNAVQLAGFSVPALTLRRASTVVELADGQSFVIAGLLQEDIREVVSKFPILGNIPVLGALFRSSSFEREETELVIIVTPRLVKPLDVAAQPLPTDAYVEPNDIEFYLFGKLQGQGPKERRQGKLDGAFGYITKP